MLVQQQLGIKAKHWQIPKISKKEKRWKKNN